MAYAENTSVTVEQSFGEIVTMLRKTGADQVAQFQSNEMFQIQFALADRVVRFRLPVPSPADIPDRDGRGAKISVDRRVAKADQVSRARARALLLVVKAKLESVESGIETLEQAFLANVVMANGETVYDRISAPIAAEYVTGRPSTLMLGSPA